MNLPMDGSARKKIMLAIVFCILGIAGFGYLIYQNTSQYQIAYAKNEKQLGRLRGKLKTTEGKIVKTAEERKVDFQNASQLGTKIEQLQNNELRAIDVSSDEGIAKFQTLLDQQDEFYGEGSKFARSPWYVLGKLPEGVQPPDFTWKFQTTYSLNSDRIKVLWICEDRTTGDLLAYTTGVYNASLNQMKDMKVHTTLQGLKYIASDTSAEEAGDQPSSPAPIDVNGIDDLIKQMKALDEMGGANPGEDGSEGSSGAITEDGEAVGGNS